MHLLFQVRRQQGRNERRGGRGSIARRQQRFQGIDAEIHHALLAGARSFGIQPLPGFLQILAIDRIGTALFRLL